MKRKLFRRKRSGRRNFWQKTLTAVLSAALLLGFTFTALAAEDKAVVTDETNTVKKLWTVAHETMFEEKESFHLLLNYEGRDAVGTNASADPGGIRKGTPKTAVIGGTGKWDTAGSGHQAFVTYAELFDGISFSAPGIYHFTLQEQDKGNPNIVFSTQSYRLDVFVVWAVDESGGLTNGLAVSGVTVYQGGTSQDGAKVENADFRFENTPKANGSLTVTKTVKGNAANKDDIFEFTIQADGVSGTYPSTDGTVRAEKGKIIKTVSLKHGMSFTIQNLPVGTEYTVTESSSGYQKTSYTMDGGKAVVIGDEGVTAANGVVKEGNTTVAFENVKNIQAPTGIVVDAIPYALLLGGLILSAVVFFLLHRKRIGRP